MIRFYRVSESQTRFKMRSKAFAHVMGIVTVAVWGVTFVNTRYAISSGLHPAELFFLRFSLAYLCIWFFTLARSKRRTLWSDSLKDELTFVLLGITGGSLYFTTENFAVKYTYVNNVSFIVCTAPLITILLARAFTHGLRMSKRLIVGSLLALFGVGVVIFNGHFVLQLNPKGDLLALSAAICWAVYSLVIKTVSDGRYGAIFVTRKVFAYGLLTIIPVFIIDPWHVSLEMLMRPSVWGNLLFLGVIASFACFVIWSWVIKSIGALKATNYVYLNPVTTVIASAIALDEPMTLLAGVGSAFILIGVYFANTAKLS